MDRRPYIAIAVAVVCVSFSAIFITWSDSPPLLIGAYRLTFASLILLPFALRERPRAFWHLPRSDLAKLGGVGLFLASHFALWITSLKSTAPGVTVASSVVLVTAHPMMVAAISHFLFRERVSRTMAAGIAVGFAGVVVITVGALGFSAATFAADMLSLLAGVAVAFYFLAGRQLRGRISLMSYVFPVYATAAAALWALVFASGTSPIPPAPIGQEFALFLAMAVVPQLGGHTVYNWALRFVPASIVSISLVGEVIGSSLLAWVLLGQVPGPEVAIGGAFILAGIVLTAWGGGRAPRGEPTV